MLVKRYENREIVNHDNTFFYGRRWSSDINLSFIDIGKLVKKRKS